MTIKIAQFEIGAGRAFVIAEIGNNHNGSFERAIEMVEIASSSRCAILIMFIASAV